VIEPEFIIVFESWGCFVRACDEAIEANEWADLSDRLHAGYMAILVDGIPRVIDGQIH
jgi:hypothetical protein